jgi:DNA (cytosine-5)-methyltransferase 1
MEINEQYHSAEELAELFNLTPQYIRSLARRGKIAAEKFGNTWLINKAIISDKHFLYSLLPDVKDQVRTEDEKSNDIIALSFFSGAMGLDIGLSKVGINVVLASEIDPCTRKTILLNKPDIGLIGDIENYSAEEIRKYANIKSNKSIDLIVGGPPCQAFSTAGKREGFNDKRGNVFLTFIDRILELKPKIAVIENVRGLLSAPLAHRTHNERGFGYPPLTPEEEKGGALYHIIQLLENGGYSVSFNLYNSANYGSPQKRERVVIVCIRGQKKSPFLRPTHSENGEFGLLNWRTFKEVVSGLEEEEQEFLKFPDDRLQYYKMLKPGQYWKHLPENLQKIALGASFYAGGGKTGFLRRLAWDKPAPTLVTDPTLPATDLAHPEKNRPLSIQEYMRIQEFPDNWTFWGGIKDKYRQIGNAVPISLGEAIGRHLLCLLNGEKINPIENFPYSRYKNTDYDSFVGLMSKRSQPNDQLELAM